MFIVCPSIPHNVCNLTAALSMLSSSSCVQVDVSQASNVLDRWINAASRTLTCFVTEEMNGYRLYTVVPVLIKFINDLTNIYVRYNRRRLKGSKGSEDTLMALVSLYDVLLTVCKVGQSQQMAHAVVDLAAISLFVLCCVVSSGHSIMCCLISAYSTSADCMGNQHNVALFPLQVCQC